MRSFSQNGEDLIVLNYFKSKPGILLSIGENDGKTLSNAYLLLQFYGWSGVLVEPSFDAYKKIFENHSDRSIEVFNCAISDIEGEFEFYESGTHLNSGDISLLSTLKESELKRWEGTENKFEKKKCKAIRFETLIKRSSYKQFDFISIDAEGVDFEILSQIDLDKVGCKVLCIETNSIDDQKYIDYCLKFGFVVLHKNFENLIFAR